ncbi:MAG: metalloregulator ArsR/SmtB family transcription factor [bacterium]
MPIKFKKVLTTITNMHILSYDDVFILGYGMNNNDTIHINRNKLERTQKSLPANDIINEVASIFNGMGDINRSKIIAILSRGEFCVCELVELLKMSQSSVSHMLRILRNLRLVKYRKQGKMVYYSLDDNHIIDLFNICRDHVKEKK